MTSIKYFILGNFLLFGFIAFPLSIFSAPIIQGPVVPAMYWKTSGGGNIFYTGGNIGIGKNNPTYLLDINGIINYIGFRMTTGASNNYILASDASGNARWTSTGSLFSSYVETDPLVSAWAKAPTKPSYNFTEITGTVTDAQVPDTVTINNASTATALQTARTIGGVSFNGTANINLPGVNTAGNQSTTGNAATATALQTSRTINGVGFNGTANITLPTVNTSGDQTISGNKTFNNDITVVGKVITDTLVNRTVAQLTVSGSIFPNATSSQKDLGATGNRWANLWLSGNATAAGFIGPLTGNASTATTFSTNRTSYKGVTDAAVAGQLMWKNYGNNHTIFDASAGTSPDGGAVNNTNAAVAWSATYPTLMGWNGANTYGVRVDSARVADSATNADTTDGYHMNQNVLTTSSPTFAGLTSNGVFSLSIPYGATPSTNPDATVFASFRNANKPGDSRVLDIGVNSDNSAFLRSVGTNLTLFGGNVGINTKTPGVQLDVAGSIATSNTVNDVAKFFDGGTSAYFIIYTKIPWSGGNGPAAQVKLRSYGYASGKDVDLVLDWYQYGGAFYGPGSVTRFHSKIGSKVPSRIRLGVWSDAGTDRVAIEIANDSAYWTSYIADLYKHNGISTADAAGWTTAAGAFPGTITNIVTVPQSGDVVQDSNGNVGIGTTAPDQRLTIKGGGIGFDNNSADKKLYSPADGDLEWMTHNGATQHGFAISSQGTKAVYLNTSGNSYLNGGNVGIGTTGPNRKLDIAQGNDGLTIGQDADNSQTIQAYIDGQWANRATYAGGCCNTLKLQPDVGNVTIGAGGLSTPGQITASQFNGALNGNATTATTASNATRLYASDSPYRIGDAAPYYMSMTYDGSRWLLQANPATPAAVRVAYADSTGNADTVDSLHGSQFMRSDAGNTVWSANYFGSNKGASSYVGANSSYGLQAYTSDNGAAAMSFHRAGQYAVNMGLDPDNVMRIGGWSAGANRWQLDMSGNQTVAGHLRAGTNVYTDQNYGYGLIGAYSATRYQGVYAMGDAYKLAADGTTPGTLYGIAWTHSNIGGQSIGGLGHQALFMENGVTQTAIGNGIWTRAAITSVGNMNAPSFVDSNNAGYYVDPSGTSWMNTLYFAGTDGTTKNALGLTGKNTTKRSDYTGDSNYWVGSMGWGATYDWNSVFMQGNGFFDNWGTDIAGAPESGYMHGQGLQVEHYNNGATGYGWQMVSGNAGNGNWYLRSIWGGGFNGWNKIVVRDPSGHVTVPTPTAATDAATKAYVDAAAGGGSLKLYQANGTSLIGNFINLLIDSSSHVIIYYSDTLGNILQTDLSAQGSNPIATNWYFPNTDCTLSQMYRPGGYGVSGVQGYTRANNGNYYAVIGAGCSIVTGVKYYSRWDHIGNTCIPVTVDFGPYTGYCTVDYTNMGNQLCGAGHCKIKP